MPNELMFRCEQRKEYKVKDGYEWRWKEVAVSEAVGAQPKDIRCMNATVPCVFTCSKSCTGRETTWGIA